MMAGDVPAGWDADLPKFAADPKGIASRDSSGKVINAFAPHYPAFVGGSADLAPVDQDTPHLRGRGRPRARTIRAAATCISASASTPWARW